ncbi:hypothetical protein GCM10022631_39590 [Deinococcus rubellus]|uniref:DUF1622 domain-containing protein n=1 Tax=Deinococcus rubellus TaxID=1889240 RepID=A0ABY5YDE3_9DEIO|nr:DUF1622 domain-containing protein [Deinococcus rubellus]UWX63095.1 DUF1622 domain-containing protein [Deinococcus rubellus]
MNAWTAPAALVIGAVGSLVLVGYVLAALWTLLRGRNEANTVKARLTIADGALTALNFEVAATLLKTLDLQIWHQIALFVALFALRTLLKRFFTWERRQIAAPPSLAAPA